MNIYNRITLMLFQMYDFIFSAEHKHIYIRMLSCYLVLWGFIGFVSHKLNISLQKSAGVLDYCNDGRMGFLEIWHIKKNMMVLKKKIFVCVQLRKEMFIFG